MRNRKKPKNHGKRSKPRDWRKHNAFRKDEYCLILSIVAEVVREASSRTRSGRKGR